MIKALGFSKIEKWGISVRFCPCLQAKDAAGDVTAFIEAFLWVRILLLALEEVHILSQASGPDVLCRRGKHRRCRDRIPRRIHRASHLRSVLFVATEKQMRV
uniref:Uncharacterized protein MANES_03G189600 n=1 Tax=Rhizophora mucronata TaxID=61149 RepID=A0A2P2J9R5_RHIMU